MEFDENNGSQVEQSGLCGVGDEIPPLAIIRMGVGQTLPIEEPLVAEEEVQCSTHVEPSPRLDPHASDKQNKTHGENEIYGRHLERRSRGVTWIHLSRALSFSFGHKGFLNGEYLTNPHSYYGLGRNSSPTPPRPLRSTWEPLFSSYSTLHVSSMSPVDLLRTR